MTHPPDDRAPQALAMAWASRVTTISMEMAVPPLAGHWLDQRFGTKGLFLVLGAVLGLVTGMWHLIRLSQVPAEKRRDQDDRHGDDRHGGRPT